MYRVSPDISSSVKQHILPFCRPTFFFSLQSSKSSTCTLTSSLPALSLPAAQSRLRPVALSSSLLSSRSPQPALSPVELSSVQQLHRVVSLMSPVQQPCPHLSRLAASSSGQPALSRPPALSSSFPSSSSIECQQPCPSLHRVLSLLSPI